MIKSKYKGNLILRNYVIAIIFLENKKFAVDKLSVEEILFDYENNVSNLPESLSYETLKGTKSQCFLIEDFLTICSNYKGRRISNNLATTIIDLFNRYGLEELCFDIVGFNANEKIKEFINERDKEKSNQFSSDFDKNLKKIVK